MIRIYLSYDRERDTARARTVRAAWVGAGREAAGVFDEAQWREAVEHDASEHNTKQLRSLIDGELADTAVTVVLVGQETASRSYVDYEIAQSVDQGSPVFGIRVEAIEVDGETDDAGLNPLPIGSTLHLWSKDDGSSNLVSWVQAAIDASL